MADGDDEPQRQRGHRGAHPEDARLFAPAQLPGLRAAVADLSWLSGRGYADTSALKLVGDRYRLHERQRRAVSRAACSEEGLAGRQGTCRLLTDLRGQDVQIDGFNLLITIEAALSGGVLLCGRDGCVRDLSSVHGSYRLLEETDEALRRIGELLASYSPRSVTWLLDKPVSNSGRLAVAITELAASRGWPWRVEVIFSPDHALAASDRIAVTSDANVLENVSRWVNLAAALIESLPGTPWRIDLRSES